MQFGQPPVGPLDDPWQDPLEDPLADPLEHALEDPFEAMQNALGNPDLPLEYGGGVYPPNPDIFMDSLGKVMTELEENVESTVILPPRVEEPLLLPEPPAPITEGYISGGAPPPPEGTERPWDTLKPPPAAIPYVVPGGLMTPSPRPRGGMGAGIRNTSSGQPEQTYCPIEGDWVTKETCENCDYYSDSEGWCGYPDEEHETE